MRRSLIISVLIPAIALSEVRSADLDKASRLVFDQKYEAAARALEVAARQTGNKREAVLRILELQGVVHAQLGQDAKAKLAFQALLSLDGKRELGGKYNAKVLRAFELAQQWAMENPPLEMTAEAAAVEPGGKVVQLAVKVKNDALKLAKKVRFSVRPEGGRWAEQLVEIQGAYASATTDAEGVEWWAELLGERDAVLTSVGSQRAPIGEGKLKTAKAVVEKPPEKKPDEKKAPDDAPKKEPTAVIEPHREPVVAPATPAREGDGSLVRGLGYGLLGLGAATVVAGTVFGVLSRVNANDVQSKLANATYDAQRRIVDPTQAYVAMKQDQVRFQATLANVMWGVGAGLILTGFIVWLVGRETSD